MTDRINSVTVVLERDIRIDDAQRIIDAIAMVSGVIKVEVGVVNSGDYIARERAKAELRTQIYKLIN